MLALDSAEQIDLAAVSPRRSPAFASMSRSPIELAFGLEHSELHEMASHIQGSTISTPNRSKSRVL